MSIDRRMETSTQLHSTAISIAGFEILNLTAQELDARLQIELDFNPALECDIKETCQYCGSILKAPYCNVCQWDSYRNAIADAGQSYMTSQELTTNIEPDNDGSDEWGVLTRVASLEEQLLDTMRCLLSGDDISIAEALIGNLNEHGFLSTSIETVAYDVSVPVERVEHILKVLQQQDPVGIGARSAQECLLLQLNALRTHMTVPVCAEILLTNYLRSAVLGNYKEIAHSLHVTVYRIREAWAFIQQHLNPFPTNIWTDEFIEPYNIVSQIPIVRPDVVICRTEHDQYEVDVIESRRMHLRIADDYADARQYNRAMMSSAEKEHIKYYVHRSEIFITNIRRRWQTMKCITEAIISLQRPFLEHGYRCLTPMTRNTIALILNFEESTISRAVRGRYVLLPSGEVVAFESLFDASLPVKLMIEDILQGEDPQHPWSDRHLTMVLNERGISIKRRTVSKYRNEMRIATSRERL